MRVPLIVISPYAKHTYISHQLGEFSSFAKFIESNWGLPSLGHRDSLSSISNLMDYFNFSQPPQPKMIVNPLPYSSTLVVPTGGFGFGVQGTLNPIIGDANTNYQFNVVYTRTDVPAVHNVLINGVAYAMTRGNTLSGVGTIYQYTTKLAVGMHNFHFTFSNGSGTVNLPDNGVPFPGPEVHPFFADAQNALVTSPVLPGHTVTFDIVYSSPSNKAPTVAQAIIDGQAFAMHAMGTNYKSGVHFTYTTNSLAPGVHYVVYRFSDGSGVAEYPGRITPLVTPIVLSQSSASKSGTTVIFQTTYADVSGNAPSQATLYVDGTPTSMSCVSNCGSYRSGAVFRAQRTLSSGSHRYFFVFSAPYSGVQSSWSDPTGPMTYSMNLAANGTLIDSGTLVGDPGDMD